MEKKYALFPGIVISETDGDIHHIDARTLAELYRVNIEECHVVREGSMGYHGFPSNIIELYPRYDGNYGIK